LTKLDEKRRLSDNGLKDARLIDLHCDQLGKFHGLLFKRTSRLDSQTSLLTDATDATSAKRQVNQHTASRVQSIDGQQHPRDFTPRIPENIHAQRTRLIEAILPIEPGACHENVKVQESGMKLEHEVI
jgi:hypothetical protein